MLPSPTPRVASTPWLLAALAVLAFACGSDDADPTSSSATPTASPTSTPSGTSAGTDEPSSAPHDSHVSSSGPTVAPTDGSSDLAALPLLPDGRHLGVTLFGSGDPSETTGVQNTLEEAAGDALSVFTFYIDWFDLESSPSTVDVAPFVAQLAWQQQAGLLPLVNLLTVDITNLNLPRDLLSPDGSTLAPGRAFDDEDIVARLRAVLDAVVPPLVEHGGFLLVLGNEVDEHFTENPEADVEAFARLLAEARAHVRTLAPEIATGVTVTSHALRAGGPLIEALQNATDLLVVNYYPLETTWGDDWFTVRDLSGVPDDLDALLALYDGRPIVLQELGCPSGEGSDSSETLQEECFRTMMDTLEQHDNVRLVSVFTLHDFDEPTCDLIVDVFGLGPDQLPGRAFERWRSYLCTLGVLRPDGTPKPAWTTLLASARGWRSQ